MSVPTLGSAAVNAMFLPNCKGMLKRDNNRRAKAHRMALLSVRGHVDTGEPSSMQFSRGQKVDMKKLRQEAARAEYIEKCNRKLVDKMMMIMQGLCGTIVSEQRFPDFNPGTLNYRLRHRELLRIDRANLALMHRLENASSGYNKEIVKPKHFQEPHMGLFPRSEHSVKSAGSKSHKRARSTGPSTSRSGGHNGDLEWGASVSSALTEASSFPTITLGKFHDASSRSSPLPLRVDRQDMKGKANGATAEVRGKSSEGGSPGGFDDDDGDASVGTAASWPTRTPHPPSISSRATCGSTSGKLPSTLPKCRRLLRINAAKPGAMVFQGGVRIGDEYAMLTVTRATEGFGEDGTQGFRMKAYCPLSVSVYSLGVSVFHLPVYTSGSHTAVRRLFQSGEKSRRKWEGVAACLELRPSNSDTELRKSVESGKPSATDSTTPGSPPETVAGSTAATAAAVPLIGLDGTEETRAEGTAASAMSTSTAPVTRLEMVLVPPEDAPVIIIQRLVRGLIARETYGRLKRSIVVIQAAIRGWKYRMAEWKNNAATKIAAVTRGKRCRTRAKQERAARGIQKRTRLWLQKRELEKERAAKTIQFAIRRRHKRLGHERCVTTRKESLSAPTTTKTMRLDGSAGGGSRLRKGRSRKASGATTSTTASSGIPNKRSGLGSTGGGNGSGGKRGSEATVFVQGHGDGGGNNQGRGKMAGKVKNLVGSSSGKGQTNGGSGDAGGSGGGGDSVSGRSRRDHTDREGDGSNHCSKPTAEGASNGATINGESALPGKTARTPPRNHRPKPPDAKDFTRSPYNRTRAGWTRAGGGASTRNSKASSPSPTGSPRPTAPSQSSVVHSDSHKNGDDRTPAGERHLPGADLLGEDISAPPPLPKSSAASKVAGAWPSGGAGTRTAKAAAEAEAVLAAGGEAMATTTAAGTKVIYSARQASPRSVRHGEKDSSAADKGQPKNEPSPETSEITCSQDASEYNACGDSSYSQHETNRQHRSSSIPWVEEAAVGKHYQPPPSTKLTGEAETERSTGCRLTDSTRRPSIDSGTAIGHDSSDPKRRTSSISWAEDIVAGNKGERRQQGSPLEEVNLPVNTSLGASAAENTTESSLVADSSTGDSRNVDEDIRNPKRRTSSVSWAEDIVASNKGERQRQRSPLEGVKSSADTLLEPCVAEKSTKPSPGASSSTGQSGNVDEGTCDSKRRTSSVSWADDIVAGNEGERQQQESPLEIVMSPADTSLESCVVENTTKSSPGTSSSTGQGGNVDEGIRDSKHRTSSVSWAEDIIEGTGRDTQPQTSSREKNESVTKTSRREVASLATSNHKSKDEISNNVNGRTSSISWAEDVVAGNGGEREQKPSPMEEVESGADASVKESATEKMAKVSLDAHSNSNIRDIGEDYRDSKRRTSSVSWAEEIAEGKRTVAQPQPSPRRKGESAVDVPTGVPPDSASNGTTGNGNAEKSNSPNRRTSSVSWAEDVVADQGRKTQL
ncbi:unnamed protein product [Hapterophycus canaliculatus]